MRSGRTPPDRRRATRHASVLVLPLPAPATISRWPPSWRTASSCSGLRSSSHGNICSPWYRDKSALEDQLVEGPRVERLEVGVEREVAHRLFEGFGRTVEPSRIGVVRRRAEPF